MTDWLISLDGDPAALDNSLAPRARDAALDLLGPSATCWGIGVAATVHRDLVQAEARELLQLSGREGPALEASVLAMLTGLTAGATSGAPMTAVVVPEEVATQVRWAARLGMPLDNLLKVIWRSHARVQELLVSAMTARVAPEALAAEIQRVSAGLLSFVGVLVDAASGIFERESAAWGMHRSASIRRAVDEVVELGEAGPGVEGVLGVRLQGHHVGAVLWPLETSPDPGWTPDSAHWVETVRERLEARSALVVPRTDGSTEAVWSRGSAPGPQALEAAGRVPLPPGFSCALGVCAPGAAGFRETLLSSRGLARAARHHDGQRTWLAEEHGALALMMQDREAASAFVRRTLAGLTATGPKETALRETLLAFLEHQGSRSGAGAQLHVAATTVAYRVQQAESRLDRHPAGRRSNLMAALALAVSFPDLLAETTLSPDAKK